VKKKRVYSIKDLREYLDLSQEQLARLAGLSGVYLSQLETGSRIITREAADKLGYALGWLLSDEEQLNMGYAYKIPAEIIQREHEASFYPEELQESILKLIEKKAWIEQQIDTALIKGKIPQKPEEVGFMAVEMPTLCRWLDTHKYSARDNAKKIRDEYKVNKNLVPASQRIKPDHWTTSGEAWVL